MTKTAPRLEDIGAERDPTGCPRTVGPYRRSCGHNANKQKQCAGFHVIYLPFEWLDYPFLTEIFRGNLIWIKPALPPRPYPCHDIRQKRTDTSMDRVRNKVVIVTGGAKGIGRSACELLAREGARIAIVDIDESGEDLASSIRDGGGQAWFWLLNTTREDDVSRVFAEVSHHFGGIDALVNNAGIAGSDKPTDQLTEAEWDAVMDINVKGVFFCTKHVIPYLKMAGGGSIVNLSSIYGLVGAADNPPYHASKGAVRLMTKTDALLYAHDHIRVNSIHPGYIWTPMVEAVGRQDPEGLEHFKTTVAHLHPLGRLGEPQDIGWAIVYLISDEAKFVTGSELVIDGGYTAR